MTLSQRLRAAAEAPRLADHVTCSHLTGDVRWRGSNPDGPKLFHIRQWPDHDPKLKWHAQEYIWYGNPPTVMWQGLGEHLARDLATSDAAIRAGLLALAEREEARG